MRLPFPRTANSYTCDEPVARAHAYEEQSNLNLYTICTRQSLHYCAQNLPKAQSRAITCECACESRAGGSTCVEPFTPPACNGTETDAGTMEGAAGHCIGCGVDKVPSPSGHRGVRDAAPGPSHGGTYPTGLHHEGDWSRRPQCLGPHGKRIYTARLLPGSASRADEHFGDRRKKSKNATSTVRKKELQQYYPIRQKQSYGRGARKTKHQVAALARVRG